VVCHPWLPFRELLDWWTASRSHDSPRISRFLLAKQCLFSAPSAL
jgi:hypothetical protein